ncbi:trypsin-like serine protease [Kitasatospora cinereorecta]|uniref:Trypsin-like serine protease n=1 Tax=Kitasatospora cinereorecta TaxID=285560 RepID=A0ABW0VJU6_9ACTN
MFADSGALAFPRACPFSWGNAVRLSRRVAWPLVAALSVPVAAWSGAVPATAADAAPVSVVEDFSYPGAAKILAERGITLKSGDGHIVLADCASGSGLVQLYSRALTPSQVCFKVTGQTGYLALEIPQVYNIKGDDHAIKATLNTDGKVSSVDVNKNAWTPVGEGSSTGTTTLLELNATDGLAVSATNAYPAIGAVTVGQAGRAGSRGCSGTLIAPQWVLTAASCFADDVAKPSALAAGAPSRATTVTFTGHAPLTVTRLVPRSDRDLVLARLASPVAEVAPAAVGTAVPAAGQGVKTGGFGRTASEWVPAAAHVGASTVAGVADSSVTVTTADGSTVCRGDAGGPVFTEADGRITVAGVHGLAGQAGCVAETSTLAKVVDARVDDIANWITANTPRGQRTSADFNGDGRTDLALTGGPNWDCLPVAFSKGDGTVSTTCNTPGMSWGYWAHIQRRW